MRCPVGTNPAPQGAAFPPEMKRCPAERATGKRRGELARLIQLTYQPERASVRFAFCFEFVRLFLLLSGYRVRIFVSEFITSGALSGESLPPSLLREGEAMCSAIVADLAALPDISVVTTRDQRLTSPAQTLNQKITHESVASVAEELAAFDRLVTDCDVTIVIAPETNGVLADRVQRVTDLGRTALNCHPEAIRLCADKLKLAEHFTSLKIPTIPTFSADLGGEPWEQLNDGCVLKPRDGAGSWLTFGIPYRDSTAWQTAVSEVACCGMTDRMIIQPWIAGRALSVGCLCHASGQIEVLPIACQRLSGACFEYRGGEIPADVSLESRRQIEALVMRACESIPGLRGYIGIDLLLSDGEPAQALIVEINPRLTTSYVGYRQACHSNLASRIIDLGDWSTRLTWKATKVVFEADGSRV